MNKIHYYHEIERERERERGLDDVLQQNSHLLRVFGLSEKWSGIPCESLIENKLHNKYCNKYKNMTGN